MDKRNCLEKLIIYILLHLNGISRYCAPYTFSDVIIVVVVVVIVVTVWL